MEKKPDERHHLIRMQAMEAAIFDRYCTVVLCHPWKTIIITLLVTLALATTSLYLHHDVFDFDPSRGFETRGTSLANARLTLDALKRISASSMEILDAKFRGMLTKREAKTFEMGNDSAESVLLQETSRTIRSTDWNLTTLEPLLVNYDDYGTDTEPKAFDLGDPCVQYSALGTTIPYDFIDYSAKIILEVKSDKLYSLRTFRKLCDVDKVIDEIVNSSHHKLIIMSLTHSLNLPHYSNCLRFSTANTCDALNVDDIEVLRSTVQRCRKDPTLTICKSKLIGQVLNYLLPKTTESDKTYVAVLLKVSASDGAANTLDFYNDILRGLQRYFNDDVKLKGAFFNVKDNEFLRSLINDCKLAGISAALILLCFLFYSRSFMYTVIILTTMILSMGTAFFFYTMILRINFFPSLNSLAIVVMIAVGADDAFVIHTYYKKYKKAKDNLYEVGDPYVPLYKERDRVRHALRASLRHSLASMFVTSATTAVAFISNLTSDIIVIRCFGVFASLTVIANFVLVLFLVPSTMMLTFCEHEHRCSTEFDITSIISGLIHRCRYIIVLLGMVGAIAAAITIFVFPGFPLPQYNPVKLLVSSHPYEWYFENAHNFNFEWKSKFRFMEYYVIGIRSIRNTKLFDPYQQYNIDTSEFSTTMDTLSHIQENIDALTVQRGYTNYHSWLELFLSSHITCMETNQTDVIPSSCFLEFALNKLPSPFPNDFAVSPSDGPIFEKKSLRLIGYFIAVPSNVTLSMSYDAVQNVFRSIDANCKNMTAIYDSPVMCLSSSDTTKYYDIIATLAPSTLISVVISVVISLVVVILCTRRLTLSIISVAVICGVILWTTSILILLGWKFSVVESTILVLTIGLGFDFTLHFAVSYRDNNARDPKTRVSSCLSSAGQSCLLGATTSVLCGIPLLLGGTAAFSQVGSLLINLGLTSLAGATLLFPAVILCLTDNQSKMRIIRL
ncbi:Ptd-2p [Parelaphostrongylus tenuis]|uniref:Ptd-2p n=1 Tax=Parelaphostrongylus tenuis TaxID=148309 RepID=A0AAD5RCG8_PARTN|nr:Ptd-2p [Parelaphostrongylus tenuis]